MTDERNTQVQDEVIDDYNRYKIGVTATSYNPAEKEFNDMLYLVAYDISSPKRLRLVAKTCQDYGVRVEKSVFECDLDEGNFNSMWKEINEIIDHDDDAVIAYRICRSCVRQTLSAGIIVRPGQVLLYMP
jgi:CRISPR-associated protein Cas2